MAQPLTFTPVEDESAGLTFTPVDERKPRGPLSALSDVLGGFRGSVGKIMQPMLQTAPDWYREMVNPVPGTAMEAGAMLGTGGMGGAALRMGARPGMAALSRLTGGILGGEAAGQLEGKPTGEGALIGSAAAIPEAGGALGSKLMRSLPGMKGRIAGQDAAAYAGEMGRQSPPLAGARTVQDLQGLAQGGGKAALGGAKEQAIQQIEQMIGNRPLNIPGAGPNPMLLREANDALSEIGARAFSRNPLDRTFQGVDQRQLYGQIASEIEAALGGLNPQAPAAFQAAQEAYKKGLALLRPLQTSNAVRLSPGATQFNTPAVQGFVQQPKNAALLRNKLGDPDYEALVNVLTRGAGEGRDVLTPGAGGMLDAAMQTFGRGTNSGAAGYLGVPLRTALPNVGSQYAGRAPYSLPPMLQQALDVVLQRQAGQVNP